MNISITAEDILELLLDEDNYSADCYYRAYEKYNDQRCFQGKISERYEEQFVNKKGETKIRYKYRDVNCPECKGTGRVRCKNYERLRRFKALLDSIPLEEQNAV